jgi:tRNA uridine 5-carboxymethylaminomethyl modification enzyme
VDNLYDVIVVGGGHAGTEAACASARMGAKTLLLTHNIDTIGQMSCNPAIGGIGKTHLVKEIDALGGVMAQAIDSAAIHVRVLNESKGPAVRATRMQADRALYKMAVRRLVEAQENLDLFQQAVDNLLIESGRVVGVRTQLGVTFRAKSVVLTVGTFLAGKIHVGLKQSQGGRAGDPAALTLSECLRDLALPVGRLKTGTPPRVAGNSIDFTKLTKQPSEYPGLLMSYLPGAPGSRPAQLPCYITRTCPQTHAIIRENLGESPMFSGVIEGVGPRYCPSIEDKITRFDREHHQVFLEPEGLSTREYYPNGISTSLSYEAQVAFLQTIPGLENAHITRPGYAIEYDFFDPRSLSSSLAVKAIPNLFFAGQINGTTGYEEAGAQGLLAGVNAALLVQDKAAWSPRRDEAYIGVLVDDLITQGTKEPYRMFTSRAEYRLQLRQDNADSRLTEIGYRLGCVSEERWQHFCAKRTEFERAQADLKQHTLHPGSEAAKAYEAKTGQSITQACKLHELLKRPEVGYDWMMELDPSFQATRSDDLSVIEQLDIQAKYSGYLVRQQAEIDKQRRYEDARIPDWMDYTDIPGLSHEISSKLQAQQPETLAQAARIPGVTPAATALLLVYIQKGRIAA